MEFYKAKFSERKPKKDAKSGDRPRYSDEKRRSFRNSNPRTNNQRKKTFTSTCSDCGQSCELPFEPKFNKPVYCSQCFEKNEPRKSRNSSFSRPPARHHDNAEKSFSTKPRKLKSQKKMDNFYSNGSEKFYESLKEKLFVILGGKVCSSCGFRDERALGFSHVYDSEAFDRVRRGGFASSWGKYISDPDLAKKEIRVLCLNCNEIREPIKKNPEKPKKKSRYFPR